MSRELNPHRKVGGTIRVPGDKSIAHRAALLSTLSEGPITIKNFPEAADCQSSLAAALALGVTREDTQQGIVLRPPDDFNPPKDLIIDCGNSGTTARLLSGLLAGCDVEVTLTGDESLRTRPMKRVIDPLTEMGAEFFADEGKLPMRIRGKRLLPFEYTMPVASAQVKSALMLAGLASSCTVTIREETITRDHTELMLGAIGEGINVRHITPVLVEDQFDPRKKRREMPEPFKTEIIVTGQARIIGGEIDIPGDFSTAAFFMAAAAISGDSLTIEGVGLNHTRTGFVDHLRQIGCTIETRNRHTYSGEPRGDLTITGGALKGRKVSGETVVSMIDEIPLVAVMAAFADGTTIIRDAAELKVKESDRLAACEENLKKMGVKCGLLEDGLAIEGGKEINAADFESFGDHRIAMAFSIASLFLVGPSTIDNDQVVAISCPNFYELLDRIKA